MAELCSVCFHPRNLHLDGCNSKDCNCEGFQEQRYGVVYWDAQGGDDHSGCFDWAFCKNVPLKEAEEIALTWDRITGADRHRVYMLGVAPFRGFKRLAKAEKISVSELVRRVCLGTSVHEAAERFLRMCELNGVVAKVKLVQPKE